MGVLGTRYSVLGEEEKTKRLRDEGTKRRDM
jgi:hypothetical protein